MKLFLTAILSLLLQNLYSQPFVWGTHMGGWNSEYPIDIEKLNNGFIFTRTASSYQSNLCRMDLNGNIEWEFSLLGDRYYDMVATCVDFSENVYALLSINANNENDTIEGIVIYPGVSLLKFDRGGKVLWSKKIASQNNWNNLFYYDGTTILSGTFAGTINFDNKKTLTSQEYWHCKYWMYLKGDDFIVAKLDTEGNFIDAVSFGGTYPDVVGTSTINPQNGDIYITGLTDYHECTINYSTLTKIKNDLTVEYTTTMGSGMLGSSLFFPSTIFYSSNDNLYLWGYNGTTVDYEDIHLPIDSSFTDMANLLEFDSNDGHFIKSKQFETKTLNNIWGMGGNWGIIDNNKAELLDYGEDSLLVFASSRNKIEFDKGTFIPSNETSKYNETLNNENLLLFTIDKKTFSTHYLTSFRGLNTGHEYNLDNPGPIFLDSCYLYLSAAFAENPFEIFDNSIDNNSSGGSTDVLLAKINLNEIKPASPKSGVTHDEYLALVDFYNDSGGPNWLHNDNWLDTINSCVDNWYGISVSEGHVANIIFGNNNLTKIPEATTRFPKLQNVAFYDGGFSGAVPDLGGVNTLRQLDLSENNYFFKDLFEGGCKLNSV